MIDRPSLLDGGLARTLFMRASTTTADTPLGQTGLCLADTVQWLF
jgi:hypothetical protein